MRWISLYIVLLLVPAQSVHAQNATLQCDRLEEIGFLTGLDRPYAITIDDGYIYTADVEGFLNIIDIRDPSNPSIVSSTDIPFMDEATSITIIGDAAYITLDGSVSGVAIINIEDKADPWYMRNPGMNLEDLAQLVNNGIHIFTPSYALLNITRPFGPGFDPAPSNDAGIFRPLGVYGDTLIDSHLDQFDISDPFNPVLIDQSNSPSILNGLRTRTDGPHMIDIDQQSGIIKLATYFQTTQRVRLLEIQTNGAMDATARGDLLYVANGSVDVYAVGDPTMMIDSFGPSENLITARFIRQYEDLMIVFSYGSLAVYHFPTNPVSSTMLSDVSSFIDLEDNLAVLNPGFFDNPPFASADLVDISNPLRPEWLAKLPIRSAFGTAIRSDRLYIAGEDTSNPNAGLFVFDITTPQHPVQIGAYSISPNAGEIARGRDVAVQDNLLYALDNDHGLSIFGIMPDGLLMPISNLPINSNGQRIELLGDLAFVSSTSRGHLIDISNPLVPTELSFLDNDAIQIPAFLTACRDGDLLYTAENDAGYRIFDISDPSDPFELARFDVTIPAGGTELAGLVRDTQVDGSTLYLALSSGGFAIYDNTNPLNPLLTSHIPAAIPQEGSNTFYREFIRRHDKIYIASGNAGLRILSLSGCELPCAIDFNTDGALNFFDVAVFIQGYIDQDPLADLNNDALYNFFDVASFLVLYNKGCP